MLWWSAAGAAHSHCVFEGVVRALVQRGGGHTPEGVPTPGLDPFRAELGVDEPFRDGPTAELRRPRKQGNN